MIPPRALPSFRFTALLQQPRPATSLALRLSQVPHPSATQKIEGSGSRVHAHRSRNATNYLPQRCPRSIWYCAIFIRIRSTAVYFSAQRRTTDGCYTRTADWHRIYEPSRIEGAAMLLKRCPQSRDLSTGKSDTTAKCTVDGD